MTLRHAQKTLLLSAVALSTLVFAACSSSGSSSSSTSSGSGKPSSAAPASGPPIQVGMALALSGSLAAGDGGWLQGVRLAAQQVNDAGGVDGHKINLHVADNASNPTQGVSVSTQLLNQNNLSVMLNGASSAQSAALVPVLAQHQVPALVLSQLPTDPTNFFVSTVSYQKQLQIELDFAQMYLHAKTIAFLHSTTPYGTNGAALLTTEAPKRGLTVVLNTAVDATVTDQTPLMSKVKDAHPDAVLDFLTGSPHLQVAQAATTVGLSVPLVMAPDNNSVLQAATKAYANTYFSAEPVQYYPNIADPKLKASIASFVTYYDAAGGDPDLIGNAADGWDAVQALVAAVKIAGGSITGKDLRNALEKVSYTGVATPFMYTPTDHTGQAGVPNLLKMSQFNGSTISTVFSE